MKYYAGIGARDTPQLVLLWMRNIAEHLYDEGWTLRSGGARGADTAFELGAKDRKQIFLPYDGFNKRRVDNDKFLLFTDMGRWIAKQYHPKWHILDTKARQYHSRNTHQILGPNCQVGEYSEFVVCWTADGKASGGTGQALRIAADKGKPIYNLYNLADLPDFIIERKPR